MDTCSNSGNWNRFRIIQNISEQHEWKTLLQGTTENSHIEHCTRNSESAKVIVQSVLSWGKTLHVAYTVTIAWLQHCMA